MAEIARLGLEIDASQVQTARSELVSFGQSAAQVAAQVEAATSRLESASAAGVDAALANIQAQFAKAEARATAHSSPLVVDLDKQNEAIKNIEFNARRLANIRLDEALKKTGAAASQTAAALEKKDFQLKSVAKTAASTAVNLADLGAGGNAFAGAILAIGTSAAPVAIGLTAIGATASFVAARYTDAKEKAEEFKRILDADIDRKQGLVKVNEDLEKNIRLLRSADPELEKIKTGYEELVKQAKGSQVVEANAAALRDEQIKKLAQSRNQELEAIAKEQQAVQSQIAAADFRIARLGASAAALIELDAAEKHYAASMDQTLQKHSQFAEAIHRRIESEKNLRNAQRLVQTGGNTVTDFQNQFGVTFDIEKSRVAEQLASQFGAVFNTFKNDRSAQGQLASAFEALVRQGVASGVPDVGELIAEKIGEGEFIRLRQGLGTELRAALDQSAQAGEQWGAVFERQMKNYLANAAEVGARTDLINQRWTDLQQKFEQGFAAQLDVSQPLTAAEQMRQSINAIPDVTYKQIILQTYYAASPARPFSEFLPFMQKTFGSLQDMVANSTPEVILNVPDIAQRLRQIADLEQRSREAVTAGTFSQSVGQVNSDGVRRQNLAAAQRFAQQAGDLGFELQADIARAQLAARGRAGGGGSGGNTYIFDAKGATFNSMTLDDALLQYERTILRTTGQDPQIRVTS